MATEYESSGQDQYSQYRPQNNPQSQQSDQPLWWVRLSQQKKPDPFGPQRETADGSQQGYRPQEQQQRGGSGLNREQQMNQQHQ